MQSKLRTIAIMLGSIASIALSNTVYADLVRVVLIDVSSSMSSTDKLQRVKLELTQMNQQLPASKSHPIVLIPFGLMPHEPTVLINGIEAQKAITSLTTQGGTDIAAALRAGREAIQKYAKNKPAMLVFISDGEDPDVESIKQETELLNKMFTNRGATGISSSVFMKRWGGANQKLADSLASNSSVSLLDAHTQNVVPVTIVFDASVRDTKWVDAGMTLEATIEVSAKSVVETPVQFPIVVKAGKNSGIKAITVPLGGKAVSRKVILKVDKQDLEGGVTTIDFFATTPPLPQPQDGEIIMPMFKQPSKQVSVTLPKLVADRVVDVKTLITGNSKWVDPITGLANFEIEVSVDVKRTNEASSIDDLEEVFEIVAAGSCSLQKPIQIRLDRKKRGTAKFYLAAQPINGALEYEKWKYRLCFNMRPKNPPGFVRYSPPTIDFEQKDVLPPHPVDVVVTADLVGVQPVRWTRVDAPEAEFLSRVNFTPSIQLPPEVTFLGFQTKNEKASVENVFRRNKDTSMDVRFRLQHSAGSLLLKPVFGTVHPSGYRIEASSARITPKRWPAPLQLSVNGGVSEITATKTLLHGPLFQCPLVINVKPILLGGHNVSGAESLRVQVVHSNDLLDSPYSQDAVTGRLLAIQPIIPDRDRDFFISSSEDFALEIRSATPNIAIEPGRTTLHVDVMASVYGVTFFVVAGFFGIVIGMAILGFTIGPREQFGADSEAVGNEKDLAA